MENRTTDDRYMEPGSDRGAGRVERVAEQARETAQKAKEGLAAGASGVAERTRSAAAETRDRAERVVEAVKEAEPDAGIRSRAAGKTQRTVDRASSAVIDAAPAIGNRAERAAEKVGQALHGLAGPLGSIVGTIAGTLGGWWKKAADERHQLPEAEEQACRTHFASVTTLPTGMTYERARTGYELGWLASRNPDYRTRGFEEVEPDLRGGFRAADPSEYDSLRDFTRYGFDRGAAGAR